MLILDSISELNGPEIALPFYHKGHLSLKSGTRVTLCLIEPAEPSFARMTEMIVSPISFRSWRHLWRVIAVFREQQGVVNKLLTVVRDAGLNVLFEESSSVQNRDLHEIELICDASAASSPGEWEEEEARLAALSRRIAAILINELEDRRGKLRLGVRRMEGIFAAWQRYREAQTNDERTFRENTTIKNGKLQLPSEIFDRVAVGEKVRTLLVSDTRERILRVFFPSPDVHFTYVRVSHLDSVGALAAITGELADEFDVVTSLTRVKSQGYENHMELLLFGKDMPSEEDEEDRRGRIEELLSNPALSALDLKVSYPSSVDSAAEAGIKPKGSRKRRRRLRPSTVEAELANLSTAAILQKRLEQYSGQRREVADLQEGERIKRRLEVLNRLAVEEGGTNLTPKVFLSFEFARTDLFSEVERISEELGIVVVSGRNPTEERVFRQAIINRVLDADVFLGVWTAKDKLMSPWFLWEYGVAQAVGKPCELLIHRDVDGKIGIRITPEQHHSRFRGPEFSQNAKAALLRLQEVIRKQALRSVGVFSR